MKLKSFSILLFIYFKRLDLVEQFNELFSDISNKGLPKDFQQIDLRQALPLFPCKISYWVVKWFLTQAAVRMFCKMGVFKDFTKFT